MRKADLLLAVFSVALWCGCERLTTADFEENKFRPSDFFDFNTSRNIELDLDYGPQGAYSFIELYQECPVRFDSLTREYIKTDNLPFFKRFTDTEGMISASLPMAVGVDSVFVYSEGMCIPRMECLPVKDGKVVYRCPEKDFSGLQTRAVAKPTITQLKGMFYSLVKWDDETGKPKDDNKIITDGNVSSTMIKKIQDAVWNGKSSKPSNLDNRKYANRETRQINTTIAKYYRDAQNKIHEISNAEVFLTFISESGANQNVLGYYYYPAGMQPANPDNLKKYIILPNASIGGNSPWDELYPSHFRSSNAPLTTNKKIQLLYVDDKGNVTTKFPPETTIGYFIIADGFKLTRKNIFSKYESSIDFSKPVYYSDKEWNKMGHFISLTAGDFLVYGLEDTETNYSYEDILFTISATPSEAIADPEHASIEPTTEDDIEESYETVRTYCYEDLWPVRGDYDMNDVVIEHSCKIGLDQNNRVVKITDVFTPVNRYMSAQVADAFAVVIPKAQRGTMRIPDTAVLEDETNSVILFKDAQDNLNREFVISRLFEDKNDRPRQADIEMDLDPYIIPAIDDVGYMDKNRREVHMPKKQGTSKLNKNLLGMGQEAYFVDQDGKHPFAITIPLSVKKGEYVLPTEMSTIDKEYPEFGKWVESDGKSYGDWFKQKK